MIAGFPTDAGKIISIGCKQIKNTQKNQHTSVDIKRNPNNFNRLRKPEKLKWDYRGYISRWITLEHRLVYKIIDELIVVAQCRFHY